MNCKGGEEGGEGKNICICIVAVSEGEERLEAGDEGHRKERAETGDKDRKWRRKRRRAGRGR